MRAEQLKRTGSWPQAIHSGSGELWMSHILWQFGSEGVAHAPETEALHHPANTKPQSFRKQGLMAGKVVNQHISALFPSIPRPQLPGDSHTPLALGHRIS